ncbi:N-terminal binuclear Zn cluster-containing/DNA binding domain-containing protein [Xylaria cf. heliscus]|nr:N-terminal binuclear Zn cluster-containing/DNA binding domain-containing protein [Xylaria cf. heliscus]
MPRSSGTGKASRAKHACRECNSRRVRCDVTELHPCSNCRASNVACEVLPSRRGRYPRKSRLAQREAAAARTLQEFADGVISEARPAATQTVSPPGTVTPLLDSIVRGARGSSVNQDNGNPRLAATSTAGVPVAEQSGNLFFGESNFLTLVPRPPHDGDELPATNAQRSAQMTFPIAHTPQSTEHMSTASPQSLHHMNSSTERYLRDEGALKFPDLSSCLAALEAYFTWFHPAFPILDQLDICQKVKSMAISPILLQAILFTAATYCNDSVVTSMGFGDRSEAKFVLYTRARLLFHADVEKDGPTLIQALFLLSFWRGGPSDTRDVRYWLGVAITLAESHGYHRSARFTTNSTHIARMRRRMWWSIYVRERQAAASLGLPSRIRDDDCDTEPLVPTDLSSETYYEPHLVSCTPEHVTYATKMVEISRLLGKIIDLHFTPGRTTGFNEEVENLSLALNNWKESLPTNMRWEDDAPSVWKYLLHLAYNHLCILVHRNGFLRHSNGTERDIVIRAASRISRIAEDMLSQEILQYGQMHMITSFFTALCVHAISLRTATGLEKKITLHRGQMCLMSLKEIQKYWKINNNILDLFLKYLDGSIVERLHGNSMASREESTTEPSITNQRPQEPNVSLTAAGERQSSVSYPDGEERTDEGLGNLYIHPFQPNMGSLGEGMFDLGLYLDSQGTMDDEMQFEGFNFLHRAL